MFAGVAFAHYSRENFGGVDDSFRWLAGLRCLILNGYDHYRVFHSKNEFARGKLHVNGVESFWSFSKRRLSKFNGVFGEKFILHLKESEFRWNLRGENLFDKILEILKNF